MSITYTWSVEQLHADPAGTVSVVRWRKTGKHDSGKEAFFPGATTFKGDPSAEGYVPFASLTEDIVLGWVQAVVVGDYETRVNEEIEREINDQPITQVNLPWEPTPAEPDPA